MHGWYQRIDPSFAGSHLDMQLYENMAGYNLSFVLVLFARLSYADRVAQCAGCGRRAAYSASHFRLRDPDARGQC